MPNGDDTHMQAAYSSSLTRSQLAQLPQLKISQPPQEALLTPWNAGQIGPTAPSWKPAVLMGTATVVTTAVLSLQASPQQTVQQASTPLQAQAQAPVLSDGDCSAVCRDLQHTQTQMDRVRSHIAQRQVALQALQTQSGVDQSQSPIQAIARRLQAAETQEQRLEWEANQLRRELQQINQQLGLEPQASPLDLLRGRPEYSQLLQQWQQVDQQLAEVSNAAAIEGPTWDPREHDFPMPTASRQALLAQHQAISSQLENQLENLYSHPIQALVPELEQAIAEDPLRLAYVRPWLTKTHRLQLVESRQQTVRYLASRLNQQQQIWQRMDQRQNFLEADIARAQETLDLYKVQAQRLQNYLHAEQQAVSSPDLISTK